MVAATPISGPQRVNMVPSTSSVTVEPTTLVMARLRPPQVLAFFKARRVSAVSPDWVIPRSSVLGRNCRLRNSEATSTSTGRPAARTKRFLASIPAWYEVPQAMMVTLSSDIISSSLMPKESLTSPSISDILPAMVSLMALGCS